MTCHKIPLFTPFAAIYSENDVHKILRFFLTFSGSILILRKIFCFLHYTNSKSTSARMPPKKAQGSSTGEPTKRSTTRGIAKKKKEIKTSKKDVDGNGDEESDSPLTSPDSKTPTPPTSPKKGRKRKAPGDDKKSSGQPAKKQKIKKNDEKSKVAIEDATLNFLDDLAQNNTREWESTAENRAAHREAQANWEAYVEALTDEVIEVDNTIGQALHPKQIVIGAERDRRVAKNTNPFKPFLSAVWSRSGKYGDDAKYRMQIQNNDASLLECGVSGLPTGRLNLIRRAIDRNPGRFMALLNSKELKQLFLKDDRKSKDDMLQRFLDYNKDGAVKTAPKVGKLNC